MLRCMVGRSTMARLWGVAAVLLALGAPSSQAFEIMPHLQHVSADSVTLAWETATPTAATLHYGLHEDAMTQTDVPASAALQRVRLDDLEPDSIYRYRLETEAGSIESRFTTAPASDRPMTFALVGNTYAWADAFERTDMWAHMAQWSPELVMHTGNLVEAGEDKAAWLAHIERFSEVLPHTWLVAARGSRDGAPSEEQAADWFSRYQGLPGANDAGIHVFDWGNTRFLVVPDESLARIPEALPEHATATPGRHTVLLSHNPLYSAGPFAVRNPRRITPSGAQERITETLENHGVRLYLSGALPVYERTFPLHAGVRDDERGVVYVVQGGAAGGHYPETFTAADDRMEGISGPMYSIVRMQADHIWLRSFAWRADLETFQEIDFCIMAYPTRLPREAMRALEAAEEPAAQLEALERLGAMAAPESAPNVLEYLTTERPLEIRRAAALALQRIADVEHAEALLPYLDDEDLTVRRHIARALEAAAPWALTRALGERALDEAQDTTTRLALLGAVHRHGPSYYAVDIAERLLKQANLPDALQDRAAYALSDSVERIDLALALERVREVSTPNALLWLAEALNGLTRGEVETDPDAPLLNTRPGAERDPYIEDWEYYMERRLLTEYRQERRRSSGE